MPTHEEKRPDGARERPADPSDAGRVPRPNEEPTPREVPGGRWTPVRSDRPRRGPYPV